MGVFWQRIYPIPTPTLPLKGREFPQRKISANQEALCRLGSYQRRLPHPDPLPEGEGEFTGGG